MVLKINVSDISRIQKEKYFFVSYTQSRFYSLCVGMCVGRGKGERDREREVKGGYVREERGLSEGRKGSKKRFTREGSIRKRKIVHFPSYSKSRFLCIYTHIYCYMHYMFTYKFRLYNIFTYSMNLDLYIFIIGCNI